VQISERKTEVGGIVAVYSDLTELKESEQRAESANRQILESLRYAGRIQTAMMPAREAFALATRDHFLIWEPRDIVGGDFFWFHPLQSGYAMVIGDCTGHGVPGAFMTLISCGLLDRAFNAGADSPAQILSGLHRELQALLGQNTDQGETDDGLEVGICFVSEDERKLVFAGARFSIWRVQNGDVTEIKGDKAGIGYRHLPANTVYRDVEVELCKGTVLYMTTDGLIDQIGGPRGRSFGKKRFSAFIAEQQNRPMAEQAEALRQTLQAYQGDQIRRDDVTVLGFEPIVT
jgi:serine phosphatase RsbU (regulator of sigma subunit)